MGKKILFINPVGYDDYNRELQSYLSGNKSADTETVEVISLKKGAPHHLDYHYYETLVGAEILHIIKQAELNGFDGAVIGCFYDPFLREAREICNRMVVSAPEEACLHIAVTLGDSYSIIVGRNKNIAVMKENAYRYGFGQKLASCRCLNMGVLEYQASHSYTEDRNRQVAEKAIKDDGADVIVLSCVMQFGFFKKLQEELHVPVLDAALAAFKRAEFLISLRDNLGWYTSKVGGYESPRVSELDDWNSLEHYGISHLWPK